MCFDFGRPQAAGGGDVFENTIHPSCHTSIVPLIQTFMHPLCHESKLPWIHFAMNPNGHASMYHCAPFGTNRTYKRFFTSTSMHVHGKSEVITMPKREYIYSLFTHMLCLLTLASHQYENACDLKGVYFLQSDMNTKYKHIASYQYEAAWMWKGVFFVQLDMNTEYVQNTSRQWEYACD